MSQGAVWSLGTQSWIPLLAELGSACDTSRYSKWEQYRKTGRGLNVLPARRIGEVRLVWASSTKATLSRYQLNGLHYKISAGPCLASSGNPMVAGSHDFQWWA